uniref:Uncharacterized protein n=1 Tax=Odontella aurita TaxID=265563 RepID=A0A7S4J379_9STRA
MAREEALKDEELKQEEEMKKAQEATEARAQAQAAQGGGASTPPEEQKWREQLQREEEAIQLQRKEQTRLRKEEEFERLRKEEELRKQRQQEAQEGQSPPESPPPESQEHAPPQLPPLAASPLSCPFVPDESSDRERTAAYFSKHSSSFDGGLLRALTEYVPPGASLLDLAADAGQLYNALDRAGHDAAYMGLDSYRNVMELAGQTFELRDGTTGVVPALCWADLNRQFDLGSKFDYVVAIVDEEDLRTVRPEGRQSFLDNLVRLAGKAVILAWKPEDKIRGQKEKFNLKYEMGRRWTKVDGTATHKLRKASEDEFLKKQLNVFRIVEGKSRPIVL